MELLKSILRKFGFGKKVVEETEIKVEEIKVEEKVKVETVSIPENKSVIEEQTKVAKPESKAPVKPVVKNTKPATKIKRKYTKKPNS